MKRVLTILFSTVLAGAAVPALAATDARLMRQPAVSATRIAFVYAGDVWVAPRAGGVAERLSTPRGEESFPRFSSDGSLIAFTGNYDGNEDLYVMPTGGGLPKRITHHPMTDRMLNWYPDGKSILYASPMASGSLRFNQLYKLSVEGGLPEKLSVPYGEFGEISPTGRLSRSCRTVRTFEPGSGTAAGGCLASGCTTSPPMPRLRSGMTPPATASRCGTARRCTSSPTAMPTSATTSGRSTPRPARCAR